VFDHIHKTHNPLAWGGSGRRDKRVKSEGSHASPDREDPHLPELLMLEKVAIVSLPIEYQNRLLMTGQFTQNEDPQVGFTTACHTNDQHVFDPLVFPETKGGKSVLWWVKNASQSVFARTGFSWGRIEEYSAAVVCLDGLVEQDVEQVVRVAPLRTFACKVEKPAAFGKSRIDGGELSEFLSRTIWVH
jgi:hypothetical protein